MCVKAGMAVSMARLRRSLGQVAVFSSQHNHRIRSYILGRFPFHSPAKPQGHAPAFSTAVNIVQESRQILESCFVGITPWSRDVIPSVPEKKTPSQMQTPPMCFRKETVDARKFPNLLIR